ncbi:discoidin domain-containing protein [Enterococcus eurekensis]|uniref:Discoidin domain-containing protein n=1 Tax=Enterococcus eurekensis TaxID=1159753 RepID=A0ABV9M5N8_9ENTE
MIKQAKLNVSSAVSEIQLNDLLSDEMPFWQSQSDDQAPWIEVVWETEQLLHRIVLKEAIQASQRVEAFTVYYEEAGEYKIATKGTMIGYQKILEFAPIQTKKIRVVFDAFRGAPTITQINLN